MDKQLDARFDRVEKALGSLVDSIAKYTPSTHLALDYAAADAELSKGLEELQTHQSNYHRIQSLRAQSNTLDSQIKDTLHLLANTRKELFSAPATVFPSGPQYKIDYDELLAYARMISKSTIPPPGALNSLPAQEADSQLPADIMPTTDTAATTPAAATPAATPNGIQSHPSGATPAAADAQVPETGSHQPNGSTSVTGATALPEHIATHLNPNAGVQFVPWPSGEDVRCGGLAALASMADRGIDPENYDPAEEKARKEREEEERREQEERERQEREERDRRMREEHARRRAEMELQREKERAEAASSGGAGGDNNPPSASPVTGKTQFHFSNLDDDDDDDDD